MQFDRKKRIKLSENDGSATKPYPFWINFYHSPPTYKVSLQEIEEMVSERLKLLHIVDKFLKSLDQTKSKPSEYYDVMISQLNSLKFNNDYKNFYYAAKNESNESKCFEARKRDHISHFLLRIYYCQNDDLRRWFVSRETELLKVRFVDSSRSNVQLTEDCLVYYGFNYEIISTVDNHELHFKVYWTEYSKHNSTVAFKLNFEDATDLVRFRKVYVNQGFAYVGSNEMISVICNQFRSNLSRELTRMHTEFYSFGEPRLLHLLHALHLKHIANVLKKSNINSDPNNPDKERIDPENIDQLAKEFFPPCMRAIHETLRKDHHLKHYGRLHYGLFLKSTGLSLEDAINFFRSEFSIINPEKFQKEYSYTIRHIYGKEGKRVQLSAYKCQKIINENAPGPTDTHGCPFRHYDVKNLKSLLIRYGINDENDLEDIINKVTKEKNYTGACSKYFSVKYQPQSEMLTIYHPNQFFREARRCSQQCSGGEKTPHLKTESKTDNENQMETENTETIEFDNSLDDVSFEPDSSIISDKSECQLDQTIDSVKEEASSEIGKETG